MIGVQIDPKSFNDFVKDLRKLGHVIANPNMQLYRAKKYKEFTQDMVRRGQLDLEPLSEVTLMLAGIHNPEYKTGTLIDGMGIKPIGKNAAEAGYFGANKSGKPNLARIAILQHTGYKIPLTGEAGKKVRAWLFSHNINLNNKHQRSTPPGTETYLVVPARPWMMISYMSYMMTGQDIVACDEFINKLLSSSIESDGKEFMKGESMSTGGLEPEGE